MLPPLKLVNNRHHRESIPEASVHMKSMENSQQSPRTFSKPPRTPYLRKKLKEEAKYHCHARGISLLATLISKKKKRERIQLYYKEHIVYYLLIITLNKCQTQRSKIISGLMHHLCSMWWPCNWLKIMKCIHYAELCVCLTLPDLGAQIPSLIMLSFCINGRAPSEPNYNKVPLSPFFPLFATSLWLASPVHWSSSIQPKTHTPSSSSSSAPSILAGISTEFLLQPYWFCLQPLHTTTRVIFFFF